MITLAVSMTRRNPLYASSPSYMSCEGGGGRVGEGKGGQWGPSPPPPPSDLEEAAVQFVDRHDRPDALPERLPQHGLRLHAHALDAVDDDERAVGDAQRGGDFGREVDVPGRVDEVDQEVVAVALAGEAGEVLVGHLGVGGWGWGVKP